MTFDATASPLAGWAADHIGIVPVTIFGLLLSAPWPVLMILDGSLGFFIFCYAATCKLSPTLLSIIDRLMSPKASSLWPSCLR